jgi:nitroreductase
MNDNPILTAIRERRSVLRFTERAVSDEDLLAILDAGRWAPSFVNSQPWEFIVVRDAGIRARIAEVLQRVTMAWKAFAEAPVSIVVAMNPARDPRHLAKAGAAATQNISLAAHSLGLASFWAGLPTRPQGRQSVESLLKETLGIPAEIRVIAVLPIGYPAYEPATSRRPLSEIVHLESYGKLLSPVRS